MYQGSESNAVLATDWQDFEEQQLFPEWSYIQPDTMSPSNLEWPSEYLTQQRSPPSSNEQSTQNKDTPPREMTPASPSSTSTNSKEAAYSRRLSQNRRAQRAHRARQREHVECLEQQLKTVTTKYDDLQKRYSSLSDAYERLSSEKERKEEVNEGDHPESYQDWSYDAKHVTLTPWRKMASRQIGSCL